MAKLPLTKRSGYFIEIAQLLFPHISPNSASNRLRKWIEKSPAVKQELQQAGMQPRQKLLSPKQVGILITYFGDFDDE